MIHTHDLVIVSVLQFLDEGITFKSSDWPLHLTIANNFKIKCKLNKLKNDLKIIISRFGRMEIKISDDALFGPDKNKLVSVVRHNSKLQNLHDLVVNFLTNNGAVFKNPNYLNSNYKPHISVQKSGRVTIGQRFVLNSLSVFDRNPNGESSKRKLLFNVKFD